MSSVVVLTPSRILEKLSAEPESESGSGGQGWTVKEGEKSKLGRLRAPALYTTVVGATLLLAQLPMKRAGAFGVRYMKSYETFGKATLEWHCTSTPAGTKGVVEELDGHHEDRTSLSTLVHVKVPWGCTEATLRVTNRGSAHGNAFKIEQLVF